VVTGGRGRHLFSPRALGPPQNAPRSLCGLGLDGSRFRDARPQRDARLAQKCTDLFSPPPGNSLRLVGAPGCRD